MSNQMQLEPSAKERRAQQRAKRYQEDPAYRFQKQENSRSHWRDKHGFPVLRDCRENVSRIQTMGKVREIKWLNGGVGRGLSFTVAEVAAVLGGHEPYPLKVIRKWIQDGRLPSPEAHVEVPTNSFGRGNVLTEVVAYTEVEVMAIISELGPHQANVAYLRKGQDVVKRIKSAIERVRGQ